MTKEMENKFSKKIQKLLEDKIGLLPESLSSQNWQTCIQNRMSASHLDSYAEYYAHLLASLTELQELIDLIVIPETWFYREERCFQFLTEYVKRYGEDYRKGTPLKILSLGCSTGEEPYSIVMCLLEAGMPLGSFRIEGVDVCKKSLDFAQKGLYSSNSFRGMKTKLRDKYFTQVDDKFLLNDQVRFTVKFKKGNVVNFPSGFTKNVYNMIFCRNLLIYLFPTLQVNLLKRLERVLVPKGILVLGEMEYDKITHLDFETVTLSNKTAFCKQDLEFRNPDIIDDLRKDLGVPSMKIQSGEKEVAIEKIRIMADRGDLEKANELIDDYCKQFEMGAEIYFLRGLMHHAAGNLKEAYRDFHQTVFLEPKHHEALTYLSLMSEGEMSERYKQRAEKFNQEL
ncbi:MAG: putative biofilm formation methyltransferase WspC [Chlamydiae bacterium]|nr:putative biofilm formation methyltransferase WspC [Chlamydiota bacterium]